MEQLSDLEVEEILFQVSRRQIQGYLREIIGDRSPIVKNSKWLQTHEFLQRQLFSHGYFVSMQKFSYLNVDGYNIEAEFSDDVEERSERIILTAHYDTVPHSPGADDNASGIAVLLEVARVIAEQLPEVASRLQFVFFDAEEASPRLYRQHLDEIPELDRSYSIQGLYGSQVWLKNFLSRELIPWKIKTVLNFESVGYYSTAPNSQTAPPKLPISIPSQGDFIGLITTDPGKAAMDLFASCLSDMRIAMKHVDLVVPHKGRVLPDTRRSDHAPFWDAEIPAIFITDTGNFRNPHYHQPTDTLDTLDIRMLHRLVRTTILFVLKCFDLVK